MRQREPNRPRPFRAPAAWAIGPLAIMGCLYLFTSLEFATIWRFFAWNALGLVVYFAYARRRSRYGAANMVAV